MEVDYYDLLGVDPYAGNPEIKRAYRRMAEVYHPDKLRELPPSTKREGEEIMRLMNEAKSVLLDPEKREAYDIRMGYREPKPRQAVVLQEIPMEMGYVQVELDRNEKRVKSKMSRVLSSMKDVFSRDKDFRIKLEEAQESVEAKVIEDTKRDRFVLENDEKKDEDVEMTVSFKVLDRKGKRGSIKGGDMDEGDDKKIPSRKNGFRIVAIEGEDDEEGEEVEWEEEE